MKAVVMGVVAIAVASVAWDAQAVARPCFELAAERFGIPAQLLRAIAEVESAGRPDAINRTHLAETGTYDIGLMQINSGHLPALGRLGISEVHLKEPCTNLQVGAWILNQQISRHGPTWNAVGAYNAACTKLQGEACTRARARYAQKVYQRLQPAKTVPVAAPPVAPVGLLVSEVTPRG